MMDGKAFGAEVVDIVKGYVELTLAPVLDKLAAATAEVSTLKGEVETLRRALADLPKEQPDFAKMASDAAEAAVRALPPVEAKEVDLTALRQIVSAEVAALPKPENGKDADPEVIRQTVADAMAGIVLPERDAEADREVIRELVTEAVAALPTPKDGKDVDQAAVEATIVDEVRKAVAALPAPKDGHSPSVEEYGPIIAETVQRAVAAIPAAKDGVNLAGALIDRDGNLILTLSNGQTCPLGRVVGKDGVDADMVALERRAGEMIAALPKPRDGKDGVDGIGFDDMTCEIRDDGVFLVWDKGDLVKEARLPIPIDRGVFKEGQTYRQGDGVTWGGSFWIAQVETADKPDTGKGWRLAVKKGRDGKDAVVKEQKPAGPVKVG